MQKFFETELYCESIRIAIRDLYGIEDLSEGNVEKLTELMRMEIGSGFTRRVFDRANIDFAMTNPFGPKLVYNPDFFFDRDAGCASAFKIGRAYDRIRHCSV